MQFLESSRAELEAAGTGLYSVVPTREDIPACRPGVIFCLRHGKDRDVHQGSGGNDLRPSDSGQINPLAPHYLVYVHDDGVVRCSFAQPKESLLLLRSVASGETASLIKLCDQFDTATADGANMRHYDGLIQKVLASIQRTFRRRAATALLSGRGGILPTSAETPDHDSGEFELVTWLVILQPE